MLLRMSERWWILLKERWIEMNQYKYEEITIGQKESFTVTITEEMQDSFRKITGDINPLHESFEYATAKGYKDRVVFGMLSASLLSTLAGVYLPGERSLIQSVSVKFRKPVYIGDTLTVEGIVSDKSDAVSTIMVKYTMTNRDGVSVAKGDMMIGVSEA